MNDKNGYRIPDDGCNHLCAIYNPKCGCRKARWEKEKQDKIKENDINTSN